MENKQNQPASGANAPGTSKTANASTQSSGSAASQRSSNAQDTAASASNSSSSSQDSRNVTPTSEQTPNRTSASLGQEQTHGESQGYRGREDKDNQENKQPGQSWMDVSSWLSGNKEIPQSVKDFGTKALDQVNKLSTTQKVVGGALLLGGIGWLSMRSGSKQPHRGSYRTDADSNSDYRSGKTYGSGDSYGSASRSGRYGSDYSSPSSGSDSWSSTTGKDKSAGYRSGSASTSPSSSLGDDDYSSNL